MRGYTKSYLNGVHVLEEKLRLQSSKENTTEQGLCVKYCSDRYWK
jgi:hypothetical protein